MSTKEEMESEDIPQTLFLSNQAAPTYSNLQYVAFPSYQICGVVMV